jgi:CubicO group peptidase (beta-lactamase class C family)
MLGFVAPQMAIAREGYGCTLVPDGKVGAVAKLPPPPGNDPVAAWEEAPDAKLAAVVTDVALAGPGVRAVVVAKGGRIVAESYAPGFGKDTPLLGWSMTKSVNAMLLGRAMAEGKLGLDDAGLFPAWTDSVRTSSCAI